MAPLQATHSARRSLRPQWQAAHPRIGSTAPFRSFAAGNGATPRECVTMTPFRPAALCVAAVFGASAVILTVQPAQAQSIAQMTVVLDATQAPRKIFHVQVTMPAI